MGLKPAPDFAQYYIAKTLEGLDVECYIDDVGAEFNKTMKCKFACCRDGESHFLMVDEVIESFLNHPPL